MMFHCRLQVYACMYACMYVCMYVGLLTAVCMYMKKDFLSMLIHTYIN